MVPCTTAALSAMPGLVLSSLGVVTLGSHPAAFLIPYGKENFAPNSLYGWHTMARSSEGFQYHLVQPPPHGLASAQQRLGRPPAHDMQTLKQQIADASPGTGDVQLAVTSATFAPRAAAFTSLLQSCAKARQTAKAMELFDAMRTADIQPNCLHYS